MINGGRLEQPIPTAKQLESTLSGKVFNVLAGRDLNRGQMISMLSDFSAKYQQYKFVMVVYMGHGFEIDGKNYLIPIDANPPSKS